MDAPVQPLNDVQHLPIPFHNCRLPSLLPVPPPVLPPIPPRHSSRQQKTQPLKSRVHARPLDVLWSVGRGEKERSENREGLAEEVQ